MKQHAATFLAVIAASVAGNLLALYLVNNVRAVRNATGPL